MNRSEMSARPIFLEWQYFLHQYLSQGVLWNEKTQDISTPTLCDESMQLSMYTDVDTLLPVGGPWSQ